MAHEEVNIAVADDYSDHFSEVVQRLKKAGLVVNQEMETIGAVSGSIDVAKFADIEKVEGVTAVERTKKIHLSPPENDVQ